MIRPDSLIAWLSDIDKDDAYLVGNKNANLGEMIQAHFPVPPGFAITSNAYHLFISENDLDQKILHLLSALDYKNDSSLIQVSGHIQKVIMNCPMPPVLSTHIMQYYSQLAGSLKEPRVAVRSSATSEDSLSASFAGQQETFLNVVGEAVLIEKIKEVWASLFEPRALFYRHEKKLQVEKASMALVIQKMIDSDSSGVMFTVDPVTMEKNTIIIEAIYGLGEYMVQGVVTPDHYRVQKEELKIQEKNISQQEIMLTRSGATMRKAAVSWFRNKKQKISDELIVQLAEYGKKLEAHYYFPQDCEWAVEKGKVYIVQTRPVSTFEQSEKKSNKNIVASINSGTRPILAGVGAGVGVRSGPVKFLSQHNDKDKVRAGDVVVLLAMDAVFLPALKKAGAVIVERKGQTSWVVQSCRSLGIPVVTGVVQTKKRLSEGDVVTVDGKNGEIFAGHKYSHERDRQRAGVTETVRTRTQLLVSISETNISYQSMSQSADGAIVLFAHDLIKKFGLHPSIMIQQKKSKLLRELFDTQLAEVAETFFPHPVYVGLSNMTSDQYRLLVGGAQAEKEEKNPALGYRGAYRSLQDPHIFAIELEAIQHVLHKKKLNNLRLLLPHVRMVSEFAHMKKKLDSLQIESWLYLDLPAQVFQIEEFLEAGVQGVCIDLDSLMTLLFAVEKSNDEMSSFHDLRNPAVASAIYFVLKSCRKKRIPVIATGEHLSRYPELIEELVKQEIHGVGIDITALKSIREVIIHAEKAS